MKMKNLFLLFFSFLIGIHFNSFTQCSTIFTTALPATTQNAGTSFTSRAGNYFILNVTAGKSYEIKSSLGTQNFCVREGSYNSGTIVSQGGMNNTANGLVYVAQITGLAYIHIYTQACNTSSTNRTITVNDISSTFGTASTIPYSQGFNSTVMPMNNWYGYAVNMGTVTSAKLTGAATSGNASTTPQEGANFIKFNSFGADAGATARFVSPAFTTTGINSVDIEFYFGHDNGYSGNTDNVIVQYSLDGNSWISVGSNYYRYSAAATSGSTEWSMKTITIPSAIANKTKVWIAFLFTSNYGNNCYLDNFNIKPTPSCSAPNTLTSSNITTTSATISWTAPVSAPANGYDYYLSTTNTAPTSGTTPTGSVSAGTTSINLTSLSTCTPYYIWVRSKCSVSDLSSWTSVFTFTTTTQPGTLSANKTITTVNDAVTFTTTGNSGTITKFQWSYDNFTSVAGTVNNPTNPYTIILNVQQPTIWFRTTSVSGTCPAGSTTPITVTLNSAPPYTYGTSGGDYISNVTLNTLNNNSTYDPPAGDGYQNFTNLSTTLVVGSSYTISASSPVTFAGTASGYAAWIDFNNNGTFEVTENIMQKAPATTQSQPFTVPSNATTTTVKMRVLSVWSNTPSTDAYYSIGYGYGEIEEYTIIITAPLPIELYKFDGISEGRNNYLFWITSTEHNTSHFNIQKSIDGEGWETITTVSAAGNSTQQIEYSVIDYNVDPIINYYRLQQYDNDGVYDTFGPISINNMGSESIIPIKYVNLIGQEIDPQKLKSGDLYIVICNNGVIKKVIK